MLMVQQTVFTITHGQRYKLLQGKGQVLTIPKQEKMSGRIFAMQTYCLDESIDHSVDLENIIDLGSTVDTQTPLCTIHAKEQACWGRSQTQGLGCDQHRGYDARGERGI